MNQFRFVVEEARNAHTEVVEASNVANVIEVLPGLFLPREIAQGVTCPASNTARSRMSA